MANEPKLKVGVIGTGVLGKYHTNLYRTAPHADLVGIYDMGWGVPDVDVHAEGLEPVRAGAARNVASGDVAAPVFQQYGERGHSDASYAGEMDLPVHHSPHNERMCATERRSESSSTACDGSKTTCLTFLAKSASAAKSTLPSPGAK